MTPLDIMTNQKNEHSTAVYDFCRSRAADMTLDQLHLLSTVYDFGYDVAEKVFEVNMKIPADALIKDRLDSLRCHDCPHFGKGECKSSILTEEAYYYCQHTGMWVAWGSSCDYVKQIFSHEVTSE